MMTDLPSTVTKYSETPLFTETTVPTKLTGEHSTKQGVWGLLCVQDGGLKFIQEGPPAINRELRKGDTQVIEPAILHKVELIGKVSFRVEFYR